MERMNLTSMGFHDAMGDDIDPEKAEQLERLLDVLPKYQSFNHVLSSQSSPPRRRPLEKQLRSGGAESEPGGQESSEVVVHSSPEAFVNSLKMSFSKHHSKNTPLTRGFTPKSLLCPRTSKLAFDRSAKVTLAASRSKTTQPKSRPHLAIKDINLKEYSNTPTPRKVQASPSEEKIKRPFIPPASGDQNVEGNIEYALVPMSKVRWSGSLGSLYSNKQQKAASTSVEKDRSIPSQQSSQYNSIDFPLDFSSKAPVSKVVSDHNLMTVSPIDKFNSPTVPNATIKYVK